MGRSADIDDIVDHIRSAAKYRADRPITVKELGSWDTGTSPRDIARLLKEGVKAGYLKLGKGGVVSFVKSTPGLDKIKSDQEARTKQNIAKLKVERQREKELFKAMDDLNKFAKKNPGAVKAIAKEKSAGSDFRARSKASLQKGGERAAAAKAAQASKSFRDRSKAQLSKNQLRFKPRPGEAVGPSPAQRAAAAAAAEMNRAMHAQREKLKQSAGQATFDFRDRSKAQLSKPKPAAKPAAPASAHSASDFRSRAKSMFQNPSSSGGKNAQLAAQGRKLGHQVVANHAKYGPVMKGPKGGTYIIYNGKKYYGSIESLG